MVLMFAFQGPGESGHRWENSLAAFEALRRRLDTAREGDHPWSIRDSQRTGEYGRSVPEIDGSLKQKEVQMRPEGVIMSPNVDRFGRRGGAMPVSPSEQELRQHYFRTLLEATFPLQNAPDPEVALEALIEASQMLTEHLQRELDELRQEQAE
jgi:hypothetical protein